jgi:hypothetical protein
VFGLYFPVSFLFFLCPLKYGTLAFGEDEVFLRHLCLKRPQPSFEGCQVVPQSDAPDPTGRYPYTLLFQFIAHPKLPIDRLFIRKIHHCLFHNRIHPVLFIGFLPVDFPERRFSAGLVQGVEPVETIPGIVHDLADLGHVSQLLGQFQDADFRFDDLLLVGYTLLLVKTIPFLSTSLRSYLDYYTPGF